MVTCHCETALQSGQFRNALLRVPGPCGLAQLTVMLFFWFLGAQTDAAELQEIRDNPPTPPLQLQDLQDSPHTLADYRGKVVLVNFWASWCPPCIYEMPGLVRLQERLSDRPFAVLAVNVGEKKYKVWKFVRLIDFDLPVLLDPSSEAFNAWGVMTLPTTFLLDAAGRIRYRVAGDPGWETAGTVTLVEDLLAETEQEKSVPSPEPVAADN